jgi:hypothetical protein
LELPLPPLNFAVRFKELYLKVLLRILFTNPSFFFQIVTPENKCFEGIFTTWSPDFELVLECAHEVKDPASKKQSADGSSGDIILKPEEVKNKIILPMNQVVTFQCVDVDQEFAVKGRDLV